MELPRLLNVIKIDSQFKFLRWLEAADKSPRGSAFARMAMDVGKNVEYAVRCQSGDLSFPMGDAKGCGLSCTAWCVLHHPEK